MAEGAKKKKAGRAGKEKAGRAGKEKKRNPVIEQAREAYRQELSKRGVADDQMKEKMRAHLKEVVKPAMNEAKTAAKSKNLKGSDRRKFVQDTVRTKLGLTV